MFKMDSVRFGHKFVGFCPVNLYLPHVTTILDSHTTLNKILNLIIDQFAPYESYARILGQTKIIN